MKEKSTLHPTNLDLLKKRRFEYARTADRLKRTISPIEAQLEELKLQQNIAALDGAKNNRGIVSIAELVPEKILNSTDLNTQTRITAYKLATAARTLVQHPDSVANSFGIALLSAVLNPNILNRLQEITALTWQNFVKNPNQPQLNVRLKNNSVNLFLGEYEYFIIFPTKQVLQHKQTLEKFLGAKNPDDGYTIIPDFFITFIKTTLNPVHPEIICISDTAVQMPINSSKHPRLYDINAIGRFDSIAATVNDILSIGNISYLPPKSPKP